MVNKIKIEINGELYHVNGLENARVNMSILPKLIYMDNTIPIKFPARFFFVDISKIIKTYIEKQRNENS